MNPSNSSNRISDLLRERARSRTAEPTSELRCWTRQVGQSVHPPKGYERKLLNMLILMNLMGLLFCTHMRKTQVFTPHSPTNITTWRIYRDLFQFQGR